MFVTAAKTVFCQRFLHRLLFPPHYAVNAAFMYYVLIRRPPLSKFAGNVKTDRFNSVRCSAGDILIADEDAAA